MIHGRIHLGMSLAGYKSPPLQDICTSQNPSRLFSLCVCWSLWMPACVRKGRGHECIRCRSLFKSPPQDPFCWFHEGLAHWFVTEQGGIFKTWTDRMLLPPRPSLTVARPLSTCLPCITSKYAPLERKAWLKTKFSFCKASFCLPPLPLCTADCPSAVSRSLKQHIYLCINDITSERRGTGRKTEREGEREGDKKDM